MKNVKIKDEVKEEVKEEEVKVEAPKKAPAKKNKKNEVLAAFMMDRNAKRKAAGLAPAYKEEEIKSYK